MSLVRNFFILLWRIWFYLLMGLPLIIMFPILLISISKKSWYPFFFKLARFWAKLILYGMGFIPSRTYEQKPKPGHSYMFIANHTSMIDIMLMLHTIKNPFVFVGKAELAKIPIFGFFYKRTCILVDRNNASSRKAVFESAKKRLDTGISICIFPEGGVPDDESVVLDVFKDGAFRLAIEHQIPIVPIVFYDNKARFSYTFFSGSLGKTRAKVLKFVNTKGKSQANRADLKSACRTKILNELKAQKIRS